MFLYSFLIQLSPLQCTLAPSQIILQYSFQSHRNRGGCIATEPLLRRVPHDHCSKIHSNLWELVNETIRNYQQCYVIRRRCRSEIRITCELSNQEPLQLRRVYYACVCKRMNTLFALLRIHRHKILVKALTVNQNNVIKPIKKSTCYTQLRGLIMDNFFKLYATKSVPKRVH